jgi:hypothetical protein
MNWLRRMEARPLRSRTVRRAHFHKRKSVELLTAPWRHQQILSWAPRGKASCLAIVLAMGCGLTSPQRRSAWTAWPNWRVAGCINGVNEGRSTSCFKQCGALTFPIFPFPNLSPRGAVPVRRLHGIGFLLRAILLHQLLSLHQQGSPSTQSLQFR